MFYLDAIIRDLPYNKVFKKTLPNYFLDSSAFYFSQTILLLFFKTNCELSALQLHSDAMVLCKLSVQLSSKL